MLCTEKFSNLLKLTMSYTFFFPFKLNTCIGYPSLESNIGEEAAEGKGGTEILIPRERSDIFGWHYLSD